MHPFQKILNRLSLQTVLTIPFVIQVIAVVGVVGYLSFKNGQETVQNLASQLRSELTARILQQLENTVERPYIINQINASSLLQGDINLVTGDGEHQLWQQSKVFPTINLIYCATEKDGAFLGVGRSRGGVGDGTQIQVANPFTDRYFYYYEADSLGRRSFLRSKGGKKFDPRVRPWYRAAIGKGESTWSEIYLDFETLLPTITATTPIYNFNNGVLIGVCATDIILSEELNKFLESLQISRSGIAFIMEPDGTLIASSTTEPITKGKGEDIQLLSAKESKNHLIQGAANYLIHAHESLENVESGQLSFLLNGKRQYLELVRFNDEYGLDWIVVLLVPESDFMEQIHRNSHITILLCVITLLITILIGILITRWLTQPLMKLSETAKRIAKGEWDRAIAIERQDVIGDLSRSFAAMAQQLQNSFLTLEKRIEERTNELIQLNQELQRLVHIDGLTQVANRRYFDQFLNKEWQRLAREKEPVSLILCDVDYFKKYNDTYGHQAGDLCLQQISEVLAKSVYRPTDLVARYGGEEFAIVLCNTPISGAIQVAERINQLLDELAVVHQSSPHHKITLSMGIATIVPEGKRTIHSFITAVDLALYAAKSQGRNRFCIAKDLVTLNSELFRE